MDEKTPEKAAPVSLVLRPLYLAAYLATLLSLFDVLPPLAGGRGGGELAFGTLDAPFLAATSSALAAPFAALGLLLAAPPTVLGRLGLVLATALAVFLLAPFVDHVPASLTLRCLWAAVLLVPLLFARRACPAARASLIAPLLTGGGVGLAFYVLFDRLEHFGYQTGAEAHARAVVLLVLVALGALAFALPIFGARRELAAGSDEGRERRAALGGVVGGVLAVVGVAFALVFLAPLTSNASLDEFVRHFGKDLSEVGRPIGTWWIAARGLFLPAMGLGLAVAAWPGRRQLAAFVFGIGVARFAVPHLFEQFEQAQLPLEASALELPELVRRALYVAALGALVAGLRQLRSGRHMAAACVAFLAAAAAAVTPRLPFMTDAIAHAPWRLFEAAPLFRVDTPLGLLAVETHVSGTPVLVVDGQTLTPPPNEVADDALALTQSLELVEANWQPGDPNPRVLLVGQLTQPRLEAFWAWRDGSDNEAMAKAELLWTTPWEAWQTELAAFLPNTWSLAPLAFESARAELGQGKFDLVVVPEGLGRELVSLSAVHPPRAPGGHVGFPWRGAGAEQPAVAWMSANGGLAAARLGERVVLAGTDLEALGLGLVQGLPHVPTEVTLATGASGHAPLLWAALAARPEQRLATERARLFRRLAGAEGDAFLTALAALMELQELSSPWLDPEQRLELDKALLTALAEATPATPSAFETRVWDLLAATLVAKRMPGETFAVAPGLIEASGRWPALEYALAHAYLEMLMPDEGMELLGRLFTEGELAARGPVALVGYGDALVVAGRFEEALAVFEAALAALPANYPLRRRIATTQVRMGAPGALEAVQALLAEDPDDEGLAAFLGAGPYPPPESGFDPTPLSDGHDH